MLCPNCGGTVADFHTFCTYCGFKLSRLPAKVEDSLRKELRESLRSSASQRTHADARISPIWVLVSFFIAISMMIVVVAIVVIEVSEALDEWDRTGDYPADNDIYEEPTMYAMGFVNLIPYIILAVLAYYLISREQKHFAREGKLRNALTAFTERTTGRCVSGRLPIGEEARRRPLLWSVIVVAPTALSLTIIHVQYSSDSATVILVWMFLGILSLIFTILRLYLLYYLTKEMTRHHERWHDLTRMTKQELARMGYTAGHLRTPDLLPDRNAALYIVAVIFTLGFFEFYWWYAIVKDGNEHFEEQRVFEDQLIALLENRPPSREPSQSEITQAA